MAALGTGDHAVRAYHNVDVEVGIHFQCAQDDVVQLIDISALVEGIGILGSGDFNGWGWS